MRGAREQGDHLKGARRGVGFGGVRDAGEPSDLTSGVVDQMTWPVGSTALISLTGFVLLIADVPSTKASVPSTTRCETVTVPLPGTGGCRVHRVTPLPVSSATTSWLAEIT